jgi:hypothetical protein
MLEKVCINEQSPIERECNEVGERNVWAAGGSHGQDHGHTLQDRQGSVLTNQCPGKENK